MIIIADKNDIRLDKFLAEKGFLRKKIQKLTELNEISVNGVAKKASYKLKIGDKIEFGEILGAEEIILEPENIDISVIYEDENMLVVNKPSGMLTHPTTKETTGTLVNVLLYRYGKDGLSDVNGEMRYGILHRLDRNTSGLLMVAKNNKAHEFLANQIKERTLHKSYRAICKGIIKEDNGIINLPIGRDKSHPEKMAIVEVENGGKESITEFEVIERFQNATYLKLNLITGRTHQIRVHLKSLNHPIFNDTLYGAGMEKVKTQEQVLQSYKLSFTKPFKSEIMNLEIEPDEKIVKVLRYLRGIK